jgi:hypothetical protein
LLHKPHVCFAEVCKRHVPSPVQAKQRANALPRAVQKPQDNKPNATKKVAAYALFNWATDPKYTEKGL